jgi:hypothetical protein
VPHPCYDQALYWITRYSGFAESALREKRVFGGGLLKYPAAAAVRTLDLVKRRNRVDRVSTSVRQIEGFDERFDDFWQATRRRRGCLLAVRDRETLTWHFKRTSPPGAGR